MPIRPQPAAWLPGVQIEPGHPRLVLVAGQRLQLEQRAVRAGGVPAGDTGAIGQVVVIRPAPVGLDILAGRSGTAAVNLQPTVHCSMLPNDNQR